MKKNAAQREFKKLQGQIKKIEEIVYNSKISSLFEHELTLRKKVELLNDMEKEGLKNFSEVRTAYLGILEYVSRALLEDYNKKNDSSFSFDEVVAGNFKKLVNSGIITILTKQHIPKLIAKEFEEAFPKNPKDEYPKARQLRRKFYLHLGDTNTGKTYNAMEALKKAKSGIYLSPLRILALENFERLNNAGVPCNLATGEEEILREGANHTSCTIEKANISRIYDVGVIDEIQIINDNQRGDAWSRALLGLSAFEIHLCGAMSSKNLLIKILEDTGEEYEIKEYVRNTPLIVENKNFTMNEVKEGDALVLFSKKRVLELAQTYSKNAIKSSLIYGDLPPEVRKKQYEQFLNKESKILISTDAIGMGVNLPIRRIVFLNTRKFDGEEFRDLTSQEVKQIAGRAGRKGIYDEGFVATVIGNQNFIKDKIENKDNDIISAVVGPSDAILTIQSLPLREKLALWKERKEAIEYYRKMDITEYLIILEKIRKYKLKEKDQWNLLKVAFDITKDDLMEQFLNYVEEVFLLKYKELTKAQCFNGALDELEIYYQKVNMYYSFSKLFNLTLDMEWITTERLRVSEEINNILILM